MELASETEVCKVAILRFFQYLTLIMKEKKHLHLDMSTQDGNLLQYVQILQNTICSFYHLFIK